MIKTIVKAVGAVVVLEGVFFLGVGYMIGAIASVEPETGDIWRDTAREDAKKKGLSTRYDVEMALLGEKIGRHWTSES